MKPSILKSLLLINFCAIVVTVVAFFQPLCSASKVAAPAVKQEYAENSIVYHLCPRILWQEAQPSGFYMGTEKDKKTGYIHFSTAKQLIGTAKKFFYGKKGLVLLAVDYSKIEDKVKWEGKSDLFPHYYGKLDVTAVREVYDLSLDERGKHVFPPEILTKVIS